MRPRLGDLLMQAELITSEQLNYALRVQVMWGGRLGTVLNELGYLDLDTLSRALAWQHSLPAALAKHFEVADRELQEMFGKQLAEQTGCIPLLRVGKRIVIASMSPLDAPTASRVADVLGVGPEFLIPAIAAELRIRYQLERVFMISRPHRYLRAAGTEIASAAVPTPSNGIPVITSELDDLAFEERFAEIVASREQAERRTYVPTLPDALPPQSVPTSITPHIRNREREASLRALRCAIDRVDVAEMAVAALLDFVPASRAAALFVVRGQVALSWTTLRRDGAEGQPIAISLDRPGLARTVALQGKRIRAAAGDLADPDSLLLTLLDPRECDLVAEPIVCDGRVVAVFAIAVDPDGATDGLSDVVEATTAAFERLMSEASQPIRGPTNR